MTTEAIISAVALTLVGLLLISNLYLRVKNKQLFMKASQSEVDRLSVYLKAQEILKEQTDKIEDKDGFVKFMSTSRDWAFEYIEQVQNDLYELNDVFEATKGAPKTVAQNNAMSEAVRKVLKNLPDKEER